MPTCEHPATLVAVPSGQTQAERVYQALRSDILAGRHQPGQRLRYAELCARYETSMGVLREGLLRLSEQGLVRGEPQQGFQVTPLSRADLQEITDARRELETLVIRRAVREGDIEWEARLLAAHHRLSRTPQFDGADPARLSDAWVEAHAAFHGTILDGCANQRLKDIATMLRSSAELYRRWSIPLGDEPDRDVAGEHATILDAVLARDEEGAVVALTAHIERTATTLLATLAMAPADRRPKGRP